MKGIKLLMIGAIFSFPSLLQAQDDLDVYLDAGVEDATKLTESYIAPLMKGFGYGINNGWYNTAKAHKTAGFDLTVTAHIVYAPKKSEFFTFKNSDYQNIQLASGESAQLPTAFGPDEQGPELEILDDNGNPTGATFNAIAGLGIKDEIGMNAIPVPMAQLGVGIVKNTDIKFRYIPKIDLGDGEVGLWGIGVMHDVKQWIPGIKALPFDLSALVGYTKMTSSIDLSDNSSNTTTGEGQEAVLTANGLTIQAIISKKISVLTLYGAVGYNKVKSNIQINGTYEVEGGTLVDPVDLEFGEGSLRATAGFRLKLTILTLHADYTLNKYPILSGGIGFAVR